jgi:hypothetical protein
MAGRLDDSMKAIVARDGPRVDEFDTYGATARTLRAFVKAYDDPWGTRTRSVSPRG